MSEQKCVQTRKDPQVILAVLPRGLTQYGRISARQNRVCPCQPMVAFQQQIFDASLRSILEKDSFQSPKSVEYALGLVNVKSVWTKVSPVMGDTAEHIRDQLALIVKRRNQIAHESDIDPSTSMLRNIDLQTVNDCRDFLQRLVSVIDTFI